MELIRRYKSLIDHFGTLLSLTSEVMVVLENEEIGDVRNEVLSINTYSRENYLQILDTRNEYSKEQILIQLYEQKSGFDRILLLSEKIKELEKVDAKINITDNHYSHKDFQFINKVIESKIVFTEKDFQKEFMKMHEALSDLIEYLKEIREMIKVNPDFEIPEPDYGRVAPTKENPLAYFHYYISEKGFTGFREGFFDASDPDVYKVDKKNETITIRDSDSGKLTVISFVESKKKQLKEHVNEALEKIVEKVSTLNSEEEIRIYLKRVISQLRSLITDLQGYEEASKYEFNSMALTHIGRSLSKSYNAYFPGILEYLNSSVFVVDNNIEKCDEKTLKRKDKNLVTGFEWIRNSEMYTVKLYNLLRENYFIATDTDFSNFCLAFSGEVLTTPLKIKWTKTVRGKLSKPLILFLIERLSDRDLNYLIKVEGQELHKKIEFVFVDHKGNFIKNLKVTSSQSVKARKVAYTPQERELEALLAKLA